MQEKRQTYPIHVHLMWQNLCNQDCHFCSFRVTGWKNNQMFNDHDAIPVAKTMEILDDCKEMGVKAIEITGGGEPLIYKYRDKGFERIIELGFDFALVTNGTAMTDDLAAMIGPKISWARISIDAGQSSTYSAIRVVNPNHFEKAWKCVSLLKKYIQNPKVQKIGVGFVVTMENYNEVLLASKQAKEHGADNIRLSAAFLPGLNNYFSNESVRVCREQIQIAKSEIQDDSFHVYDLFTERINSVQNDVQNYSFCGTKEMLCVIGGDLNVYTCCSLAFNDKGLIGSITHQRFKELWDSKQKSDFFIKHDPRQQCKNPCIYEQRNKIINELLEKPAHVNFF